MEGALNLFGVAVDVSMGLWWMFLVAMWVLVRCRFVANRMRKWLLLL